MIDLKFDSSKLDYALTRLALAAKTDLGLVIKEEGRYITKTLMQFTPPKSRGQGTGAIRKDLGKLAVPLSAAKLEAKATGPGIYKSLARLVRRRETQKINDMMRNPRIGFYGGRRMMDNVGQLQDAHRKARNNYGRIGKDQMLMSYFDDQVALRKGLEGRVGWTISGWIPAAKATGAKFKKFADRFGEKSGLQQSNFGPNPYLVAVNRQVKIPGYQRTVDAAFNSRVKTTLKKVDRLLANKAVNLGFAKVDGAGRIEPVAP